MNDMLEVKIGQMLAESLRLPELIAIKEMEKLCTGICDSRFLT